jgi:hypothetical protein
MSWREWSLILLLRIDAVILLTALIPSVMPFSYMKIIHQYLGLGELPESPLIGYLTRSLSIVYAMHGAVQFFVSVDVRRYLPVVKFIAVLKVLFGLGMTGLDVAVDMPWFWSVSEGPIIFLLGCAILWLASGVETVQE